MLSPYRVLDLTDERGQLAGFLLAQLGAEVILVEPDEGSAARAVGPFAGDQPGADRGLWHWAYNRGKKSVTLGHVDLAALAATADALIECGAVPVDLEALRRQNPALVTASISAFGSTGPKSTWLASDLTVAAASGQLVLVGDADRPPVRISEPQAFHHAAIEAAAAVVVALLERGQSGSGQHVDASAQQSLMQAAQLQMLTAAVGAPATHRQAGGMQIGPYRLRFVYPALDGHVSITFLFGDMIGPYTQRLMAWVHDQGFCSAQLRDLDYVSFFALLFADKLDPQLLTDATDAVAAATATMTKAELFALARERRLLIVPVTTTEEVSGFEQFQHRGFWDDVERSPLAEDGGRRRCPGRWAHATRTPLRSLARPPRVGEHDGELAELLERRPTGVRPVEPPPLGRALEGLKVLDLSWVIAGPMATRLLADHGATVVRIETELRPDVIRAAGPFIAGNNGMDDTALWHSICAGKCSLQLNVRNSRAREVILDLARWADLAVESFTPGVLRSAGLAYEDLAAVNPKLVMLSSSLLGQTGPCSQFSGFGNLAAAITGFYEITGWPDRAPAGPFMAYTDYVSPRFAALAAVAAVDHARRTGEGQYIDLAQGECALQLISPALIDWAVNGRIAHRYGNDDARHAPNGVYPAGDPGADQWIAITCQDDSQWQRLSGLIARPDLAQLSTHDRLSRRRELDDVIGGWTTGRDPDAMQQQLQQAGVCAHQVQQSRHCLDDPQLAHRQQFRQVPHRIHGHVWVEGPHVQFSRTPAAPASGGPTLGEHTEWVLREVLGYDDDRMTDLVIQEALQ